jgi:hypothetical protein
MKIKYRYLYVAFVVIAGATWLPVLARSSPGKKPNYRTTREYIINNFKGAIEITYSSQLAGGVVIGYYLLKYHHKPRPKTEWYPIYRYNFYTKCNELIPPKSDITIEGEANLAVDLGIHFPQQEKWKPSPNDPFKIVDKFLKIPIDIRWALPVKSWWSNAHYAQALGCIVEYLRSSTYIANLHKISTDKLPIGKPGQHIDLKAYLKDLPVFYYTFFYELGLIFPIGLYANFVIYAPLEFFYFRSQTSQFLEDGVLDGRYVRCKRTLLHYNMFAFNIGFDFCRLLKNFDNG